jgi:hypothetical protein
MLTGFDSFHGCNRFHRSRSPQQVPNHALAAVYAKVFPRNGCTYGSVLCKIPCRGGSGVCVHVRDVFWSDPTAFQRLQHMRQPRVVTLSLTVPT